MPNGTTVVTSTFVLVTQPSVDCQHRYPAPVRPPILLPYAVHRDIAVITRGHGAFVFAGARAQHQRDRLTCPIQLVLEGRQLDYFSIRPEPVLDVILY